MMVGQDADNVYVRTYCVTRAYPPHKPLHVPGAVDHKHCSIQTLNAQLAGA